MMEIQPTSLEVLSNSDGERVALLFEAEDSPPVRVILSPVHLQALYASVGRKLPPGQGSPISLRSHRPGSLIAVHGWSVLREGDLVRLELQAEVPEENRVVTIPFSLSLREAKDIINQLVEAL